MEILFNFYEVTFLVWFLFIGLTWRTKSLPRARKEPTVIALLFIPHQAYGHMLRFSFLKKGPATRDRAPKPDRQLEQDFPTKGLLLSHGLRSLRCAHSTHEIQVIGYSKLWTNAEDCSFARMWPLICFLPFKCSASKSELVLHCGLVSVLY